MIPIHPTRRSSPLRDWLDVPKDPYKPHQHRTLKKKTPFTDPLRDTDYSQWSSRRNAASLGRAAGILPGCHEMGDKDEDRAEEGRHRDFLLGNTNVQHGNLYDSAISQHVSFPCFVLCTFPVSISCPTVVALARPRPFCGAVGPALWLFLAKVSHGTKRGVELKRKIDKTLTPRQLDIPCSTLCFAKTPPFLRNL